MDLRAEAEELAIALELGFAAVQDAVDWADAYIVALQEPPYALIEVSSAGRSPAPELAHLLRTIPGQFDIGRVSRQVIVRMASALDTGAATPEHVARALYSMQLDGRIPDSQAESDMARLVDEFDLAHAGTYGTIEEATRDLHAFLARYAA